MLLRYERQFFFLVFWALSHFKNLEVCKTDFYAVFKVGRIRKTLNTKKKDSWKNSLTIQYRFMSDQYRKSFVVVWKIYLYFAQSEATILF